MAERQKPPSQRRRYRRREITIAEPKIVPMPEQDRSHAVAVLVRWFAELLNDDDFRVKADGHVRKTRGSDST